MTAPNVGWPLPKFWVGQHDHLHALGVIAVTVAQFERSIDSLYYFHPHKQNLPAELAKLYYYSLDEEKRLKAIISVFKAFEMDQSVVTAVENLLQYFRWCRNARNQLLHAESYPPGFGGEPDFLYLTKRQSKQSAESGYMKLSLKELRTIAERVREGIVQSGTIHIHLRVRGQPLEKVEQSLRVFAREPLPQELEVPPPLKLTDAP